MRTVNYRARGGDESHRVLTPEEAGDLGLPVVANWRAGDVTQWVATDDGFVVQVLKAGRLGDGTKWVRTCTGTFRALQAERLDTADRASRYTFNGKRPEGLHKKVTKSVERFGKLVARGMPPADAYQASFPRATRRYAERRAKWLLKREEVRQVVAQELGDLMDQLGMTQEWILTQFMEIAMDTGEKAVNARVSALKELAVMRGMIGKVKETKTLRFTGIPAGRLAAAEAAARERLDAPVFAAEPELAVEMPAGIAEEIPVPAPGSVEDASFEVTLEEISGGL